jgi:hypothetical protein
VFCRRRAGVFDLDGEFKTIARPWTAQTMLAGNASKT